MRDFLKSRLQKLPEGVIVNALDLEIHASSGDRTVKRHDSRIKRCLTRFIFCGLEGMHWSNPCGTATCVFLAPYQARFFCALESMEKAKQNNSLTSRRRTMFTCLNSSI